VYVLAGAEIGADCNIRDHTFIEGGVQLDNRVRIKCGVCLWSGVQAEDDVFVGPDAVFTNDNRRRSRIYPPQFLKNLLKEGCSIGANSTILPGLTIGRWAMVGAGAVATHSVPDFALVVGSPARFRGWVCRCGKTLTPASRGRLFCDCTRSYEQISANHIREVAPG